MSLSTNVQRRRETVRALASKSYRDTYVAQHIKRGIAFQLRALREARGWTQEDLGARAQKRQSFISSIENPDNGNYTINTLKELASAFDVALVVRFVPFSELVDWTTSISPETLAPSPFAGDAGLLVADGTDEVLESRRVKTE